MSNNFDNRIFSKRLEVLLINEAKNNKHSESQIAKDVGISRATLSKVKNGHSNPSPEILYKLAQRLGVSIDYLLGMTDASAMDLDVRAIWEATGLEPDARKGLMALTQVSEEIDDEDEEKSFYAFLKNSEDTFQVVLPSLGNEIESRAIQNLKPSRKTVINMLLQSEGFAEWIDALRDIAEFRLGMEIRKLFRDISLYHGAEREAREDSEQSQRIGAWLLQMTMPLLIVIENKYLEMNRKKVDTALKEFMTKAEAQRLAEAIDIDMEEM